MVLHDVYVVFVGDVFYDGEFALFGVVAGYVLGGSEHDVAAFDLHAVALESYHDSYFLPDGVWGGCGFAGVYGEGYVCGLVGIDVFVAAPVFVEDGDDGVAVAGYADAEVGVDSALFASGGVAVLVLLAQGFDVVVVTGFCAYLEFAVSEG